MEEQDHSQHDHDHSHCGHDHSSGGHSHAPNTPMPVIAQVSRVVAQVVDRITGDRNSVPLLVSAAIVEALKNHGVQSRVIFGQAAWCEVLEDQSVAWVGCWGDHHTFWVATEFGEIVDLNASVSYRKSAEDSGLPPALYSPPMLWAHEWPKFYRYQPEGVAEIDLTESRDQNQLQLVLEEVRAKCRPDQLSTEQELDFLNEPMICPGRKLLDDSKNSFRHYDRALAVRGIPQAPEFRAVQTE